MTIKCVKNTKALECLNRNKTFKQHHTIETFLISKYTPLF